VGYTQEKAEGRVINRVKPLKVCFGINCTLNPGQDSFEYEKQYQNFYKPLILYLYNLPEFPFTLSMAGSFIEWMERKHPEFFMILNEMIARKQIDILGGGYYSPFFPLIPPADRVGQIELLTTTLRKYFGKRPRGAWITASAWEPDMVPSLNSCGIEYVLLDKIMLETSGFPDVDGYSPVTLEDNGKTVIAIPLDNRFCNLEKYTPSSFFNEITSYIAMKQERVIVVFIDHTSIPALFSSSNGQNAWFDTFLELVKNRDDIELSSTGKLLKTRELYKRAYISNGMSPFEADYSTPSDDKRILARTSIKQFFLHSPNIMNVYAKMMYVHILVNQLKGDKSRKNNAREELWRAQNSEVYRLLRLADAKYSGQQRMLAYKNLLSAEKTSRLRGVFTPSVIAFDFDMDGLKEFLCQLESLNIYVHSVGGRIFELDILNVSRNYCEMGLPTSGFFVDHFLSSEQIIDLENSGKLEGIPVFSNTIYQDITIDSGKHEILLRTNGYFGSLLQPVTLRKQYSFRNEGIQLQYILKNESPMNLSGVFMIEIDPIPVLNPNKIPLMTVYTHDTRKDSSLESAFYPDVSWIQVTDLDTGVKFTLDANENPSFISLPVFFPTTTAEEQNPEICGSRLFLYWKVELGPGFETEKMVFLKIES